MTGVGVGSGSGVVVRVVAEWCLRWLCVVVVLDCAQAGRRVFCSKIEVVEDCKCQCNCVVVVLVGVEWSSGLVVVGVSAAVVSFACGAVWSAGVAAS